MSDAAEPETLDRLLDQIDREARESGQISVGDMLQVIGRRSFGPLLLIAGLITLAPVVGDVPGVPTVIGLLVLLVATQILFRRRHIWLPRWLLKRAVKGDKAVRAIGWMRKPARFVDRLMKPRLQVFIEGPAFYLIVGIALLVAAAMPLMEVVPFSANAAGAALTAMGLALIARDGLLALIAAAIIGGTAALLVYYLI